MAYDFLSLADKSLAKQYNAKPERPAKDPMPARRKRVTDFITKALASIAAKDESPKRGAYSTKGGISKATIRYGAKPIAIGGQTEFYVPWERLSDFYTGVRQSVVANELDAEISAVAEGKGGSKNMSSAQAPRSDVGRTMDPVKVYGRNIGRYGQARADELLDKKHGKEAASVREAYKQAS